MFYVIYAFTRFWARLIGLATISDAMYHILERAHMFPRYAAIRISGTISYIIVANICHILGYASYTTSYTMLVDMCVYIYICMCVYIVY